MRTIWLAALVCIATTAHADRHSVGDWSYGANPSEEVFEAGTTASDGEVSLSQVCLVSEPCFYLVNFDVTCESDSQMPALVNTDIGALSVTLLCTDTKADDGTNYMVVMPFEKFDEAIRGAKRLGFVMPMENDEFHAVRFSLRGAVRAIDRMRAAAARRKPSGSTIEGKPAVQRL